MKLDKILFDKFVERKRETMATIIQEGVLGSKVDWYNAPKPTGSLSLGPLSLRVSLALISPIDRGACIRL